MVLLVLFATTRTNIDPLQVLSTMAPKQDRIYARGQSKSVAPSARMVIGSDDEREPEYLPPGTSTPSSFVDDPEGVPVSVRSSSVCEAVTTPDATFLGMALGACAAREGM